MNEPKTTLKILALMLIIIGVLFILIGKDRELNLMASELSDAKIKASEIPKCECGLQVSCNRPVLLDKAAEECFVKGGDAYWVTDYGLKDSCYRIGREIEIP